MGKVDPHYQFSEIHISNNYRSIDVLVVFGALSQGFAALERLLSDSLSSLCFLLINLSILLGNLKRDKYNILTECKQFSLVSYGSI